MKRTKCKKCNQHIPLWVYGLWLITITIAIILNSKLLTAIEMMIMLIMFRVIDYKYQ